MYDIIYFMENFFNKTENPFNKPLENQYDDLKDHYQKIFIEAAESIRTEINKFKPENPCVNCTVQNCKVEKKDVFTDYPVGCKFRDWQKEILTFLNGEYRQKLKNIYKMIMDKRVEYSCAQCGNCCRLATSEYSYQQLKQRAMRGDKFASDFTSVFVPYETEEDAKKANPEFFQLLNETVEDQKIYYYYCPKMKDNKCTDYESRPDVCKNFPHNPLKLLPSTCAYNAWKDSISKTALSLKAKTDIIAFYKDKLG